MANLNLFSSLRGAFTPPTTSSNEAGGLAYERSPEQALALYAATGCLNGTYYAGDEEQLAKVLLLATQVAPEFVAKTAVHARRVSHMKDMPALLLASLSLREGELFAKAFARVVDNGRMLRNVVQILRSGRVGRKSLGSRPKRLVREWIQNSPADVLVNAAIGNQPSLADLIRMVHPKPANAEREALYAWIVGRPFREDALPATLQAFEAFKRDPQGELPELPFLYFTSLPLTTEHWKTVARKASWQTLRMNLNHFGRHGVFDDEALVRELAAKLREPAAIAKARVFPYQLLMAYRAGADLPAAIREALHDAMEVATRQVPVVAGRLAIAVDVSGSMGAPITGYRRGSTSAVRCVDVAALIAATMLRANPDARVLPFDTEVRKLRLEPRDSVMTQASQLAALCGGGTAVSKPLAKLNAERARVDLLVLVSDNESWRDTRGGGPTETMRQWALIKARCPQARLVCIDLQPVATSQTVERDDVLHVGGFSDAVFDLLAVFAAQGAGATRWVERIASIEL
jgi:60 kDa SS-A/Ro ribonucleoprotein